MASLFRQILETAKAVADEREYTSAQVVGFSHDELAASLSIWVDHDMWTGGNAGFSTAIQRHLALYLRAHENAAIGAAIYNLLTPEQVEWFKDNPGQFIRYLEAVENPEDVDVEAKGLLAFIKRILHIGG